MTDTVGEVFNRINRHYEAGANVLVGDAHGFAVLTVKRGDRKLNEVEVGVDVHADSPMGMFLAFAFLHRDEDFRASVVGQYSAKLQADRAVPV